MANVIAIDPARLRRAVHLAVTPLASGDFIVGDWSVDALRGCTCPDRQIRGATCKHELAVRLSRLDPEIREALIELVNTITQEAA